jgi:hypothetical protein
VPKDILFPPTEPLYVFERDCLAFRAIADSKNIQVLVTAELLLSRFGALDESEKSLRDAYRLHKDEIQAIARGHIENGWVNKDGDLFLTTRFTRLSVSFGAGIALWPEVRALVQRAHRILLDLIGPNAREVHVLWDVVEDPPLPLTINVSISDTVTRNVVETHFTLKEAQEGALSPAGLASVWGEFLLERSRYLLLKMG